MSTVNVDQAKLAWSLFLLRLGVFVVMIMWTIDKFLNPEHAAAVFKTFYFIGNLSNQTAYAVGGLQALIVVGFFVGFQKRWTTLGVLIMHFVSTITPISRYLDPWSSPNLLFYAAWPMLAATIALYLLRDQDTLFSMGRK